MIDRVQEIYDASAAAVDALLNENRPHFNPVRLLVVSGSSSEIAGGVIGHNSTYELGEALANAVIDRAEKDGFACAFQCCEHLNRALAIEREAVERLNLVEVCAVPWPKAGGSCASAAYRLMKEPALVEAIQADAGIDIGDTLIGMHLKSVAVPVRLSVDRIGQARLVCARTRPKRIGGERAKYALE